MTIQVFPSLPGLTWPISRTSKLSNARNEAISGARTIYPLRITPRWVWKIDIEFLRSQQAYGELQTLVGFFNATLGGAYPFAFTDAEDNAATAQSFGEGDGTTTAFQLVRSYGGFTEPVYLPTGTPQIFVAGTLQTGGYAVGDTGVVTFTAAPAAGALLTWTGSFNWLCRFDQDEQEFSNFMQFLWEAKSLQFSSEINP